jgi:hypothetical protein
MGTRGSSANKRFALSNVIIAFGEPVQVGLFAAIKGYPLAGLGCLTSHERQTSWLVADIKTPPKG